MQRNRERYIEWYKEKHNGCKPTVRQIADVSGLNTADILIVLEKINKVKVRNAGKIAKNTIACDSKDMAIIEFVREFILTNGYSPTIREIGAAVGLASSSVHHRLERIYENGLLSRENNKPTTIGLVKRGKEYIHSIKEGREDNSKVQGVENIRDMKAKHCIVEYRCDELTGYIRKVMADAVLFEADNGRRMCMSVLGIKSIEEI